ncbi:MAG: PH domain-containing protein [Halanaeroarchaeum sp.]
MSTTGVETDGENLSHQAASDGISLLAEEVVLANRHPDWSNWPKSIILGSIFALGALGAIAGGEFGGFFGSVIVAGLIFGYVYLARKSSRYIVTNQRVKKNVGLIRNSSGETRLNDIRSLSTSQGLIERIFGKGAVQIDSTGAGGTLSIRGVSDHEELANIIREQQQKAKD